MAYGKPNYNNTRASVNHNHDGTYTTKTEIKDVVQRIEDLKTDINYDVEIISDNGNMFKNGQISTTLRAIVRKGKEDITSTIDANKFQWTRVSSDKESDDIWNMEHFGGTKTITITKDDVNVRATFNCSILE